MAPTVTESLLSFQAARTTSDLLFAEVLESSFFERPIPQRNRIIFYLGHMDAFDWRQIGSEGDGEPQIDRRLDTLFAFGIDPPPGQLPQDTPSDWPSLGEARAYVRRVRAAVEALLPQAPDRVLDMLAEHRWMHAETFAYMLHNLDYDKRRALHHPAPVSGPSPALEWVDVPAGEATLGRPRSREWGWDNEYELHIVKVPAFQMSRFKITNGQYAEFVQKGGPVPHYWVERGGAWSYRAYGSIIPLPPDWPVYVSQAQADAFARFKGMTLPSEAQFHRAAYGTPSGEERSYPWGEEVPDATRGNFAFVRRDPVPVASTPRGDSAFGVSQLVGNGWELTSTRFGPFPGFEPDPRYPGYSAPFFDEVHHVLKGGSCLTGTPLLRRAFRNWFRRDYVYPYGTFHVVSA
jgi:formylglycine-generating enzyme required for sulfatase activity